MSQPDVLVRLLIPRMEPTFAKEKHARRCSAKRANKSRWMVSVVQFAYIALLSRCMQAVSIAIGCTK